MLTVIYAVSLLSLICAGDGNGERAFVMKPLAVVSGSGAPRLECWRLHLPVVCINWWLDAVKRTSQEA